VQPLFPWKHNKYFTTLILCICSLRHPACNAHAPYCHVGCPVLKCFSTLSQKRHDFRETLPNTKSVFWYSPQIWCMCDRASYMKMTRGTNLMQQLWFITCIINNSTCFGHLYVHLQECRLCTAAYGVQHCKR